jgi:hypothetical protein
MEAVLIRWAILLASSRSWFQLSAISILPSDSFMEHSRTALSASLVAFVALAEAVIAHAKMLLKILLGILEVVLGFRREHESAKNFLAELF